MNNDPLNSFNNFSENDSFGSPDSSFGPNDSFGDAIRKNHFEALPFILLGGLATSCLAVLIVFFCSRRFEVDVLSFILGPFPIGAFLLGALAGSGYAIVSRVRHFRLTIVWILILFLVQLGVFLGARYTEYLAYRHDFYQELEEMNDPNSEFQKSLEQLKEQLQANVINVADNADEDGDDIFAEDNATDNTTDATEVTAATEVTDATEVNNLAATAPDADDTPFDESSDTELSEDEFNADDWLTFPLSGLMSTEPPTFWEYYKYSMEHTSLGELGKQEDPDNPAKELGIFGYLFEGFIMLSFCAASIFGLVIVYSQPYCGTCGQYLKKSQSFLVPIRTKYVKIKKKDIEARNEYYRNDYECLHTALAKFNQLSELVVETAGHPVATCDELDRFIAAWGQEGTIPLSEARGYANWLLVDWYTCPECDNWQLNVALQMSPENSIPHRIKGTSLLRAGRDKDPVCRQPDTTIVDNLAATLDNVNQQG